MTSNVLAGQEEMRRCFCWRSSKEGSSARSSFLLAAAASLVVLALVVPVYLLGLGLASLASLANGVNPFSSGVFADPAIWIPLFGTSGLAGLMLLVATSRKTVIAFSFDSETRQLSYVETAPLRKLRTTVVPFESIRAVTPTALTSYATAGYLSVVTRLPGQDEKSLWLGNDIPVESLQEHCTWLSRYLGDRVHPLLRQDC